MKSYFAIIFTLYTCLVHAQVRSLDTKANTDSIKVNKVPKLYNLDMPVIAPDFYTTSFGFFCKQELKLEKKNVPLKFRVGNPEYCNYLESKNNNTLSPLK